MFKSQHCRCNAYYIPEYRFIYNRNSLSVAKISQPGWEVTGQIHSDRKATYRGKANTPGLQIISTFASPAPPVWGAPQLGPPATQRCRLSNKSFLWGSLPPPHPSKSSHLKLRAISDNKILIVFQKQISTTTFPNKTAGHEGKVQKNKRKKTNKC